MNHEKQDGDTASEGSRQEPNEEILMAELVDPSTLAEKSIGADETDPVDLPMHASESGGASDISLVERMLSPESLQRMMMVGGGLLAVGFAIWLWSIGVFNHAWVLACAVGAGNVVCLAGGAWLFKKTKLKTAGLGLIMLSCLVMPLNLWLYHSQELIVLGAGGQLWIPALFISIVYASIARLTRNAMFVYTLIAGVVMTGLLFLAGVPTNMFWAALPTSTFLVAVGAMAIQADRWFSQKAGAFSRDEFGAACFYSGMITLVAGLGVLLGGQLLSFVPSFLIQESAANALMVLTITKGKLWTLAVLGGAIYSCVHAMMFDRNRWYVQSLAVMVSFWSANQVLYLLDIRLTLDLVILTIGGAIVAFNVWSIYIQKAVGSMAIAGNGVEARSECNDLKTGAINKPIAGLGVVDVLSVLASVGLFGFLVWQSLAELGQAGALFVNWQSVVGFLLVSAGVILSPAIWREGTNRASGFAHFVMSFAGLAFASAVVPVVGPLLQSTAESSLVFTSLAALIAAIAVNVIAEPKSKVGKLAGWFASGMCWATALVAVLLSMFGAIALWAEVPGSVVAMSLAIAWWLVAKKNPSVVEQVAGSMAAIVAVIQVMSLLGLTGPYALILTCSVVGWLGVIACRLLSLQKTNLKASSSNPWVASVFNSLVLIGATASVLFAAFSIDQNDGQWSQVALLGAQAFGLALSAVSVGAGDWRKSFLAGIPIVMLTGMMVLVAAANLTMGQQIEICCLFAGILVTAGAYIGWATEKGSPQDSTTVSFWIGTGLLVLPMAIGLLLGRIDGGDVVYSWRGVHEIGSLVVGLVLLGSGILCRIRSTTLGGAVMLATLLLSNLLMINWPGELKDASVLMMIGGGSFFAVAVLLSVYRDRVLQLPQRVREGRGLFRVMKWR